MNEELDIEDDSVDLDENLYASESNDDELLDFDEAEELDEADDEDDELSEARRGFGRLGRMKRRRSPGARLKRIRSGSARLPSGRRVDIKVPGAADASSTQQALNKLKKQVDLTDKRIVKLDRRVAGEMAAEKRQRIKFQKSTTEELRRVKLATALAVVAPLIAQLTRQDETTTKTP